MIILSAQQISDTNFRYFGDYGICFFLRPNLLKCLAVSHSPRHSPDIFSHFGQNIHFFIKPLHFFVKIFEFFPNMRARSFPPLSSFFCQKLFGSFKNRFFPYSNSEGILSRIFLTSRGSRRPTFLEVGKDLKK